jgi:tRNA(Ile)-lysidine synthase
MRAVADPDQGLRPPVPPDRGGDDWLTQVLQRCRFPDPAGSPYVLAVSGGADSMALMALAHRAGLEAQVVHVDHGLRPGSDKEAGVVKAAAGVFGYPFSSVAVSVAPGSDLEARARRARYGVLPAGVLTGHTMDDQAETLVLNLMRGAGLDGLAGMRVRGSGPGPGRVVRPLLGLRRAETSEVCRRVGLRPLDDPSNADPRFRRNRVRREVVPLMAIVAERDPVPVLARQAALIADDVELLESLAARLDPTDVQGLRAAHPALARRALRKWLRTGEGVHPPSGAELARVLEVVEGRRQACQVSGGRRVARSRGRLYLSAPADLGEAPA